MHQVELKVPGALRLLRSDGQLPRDRQVPPRGNEDVIQADESAEPAQELQVGGIRTATQGLPVATTASASQSLLSREKDCLRSRVR